MGVFIGGYRPGNRFNLTVNDASPKILAGSVSSTGSVADLDALYVTETYTPATVGTQYKVNVNIQRVGDFGTDPTVNLFSSDESIATVNEHGDTQYVDSGVFTISGVSEPNEFSLSHSASLLLENVEIAEEESEINSYIANPFVVEDHVLVVYNSGSQDSEDLKDYYLANRPNFSNANVLGLNCVTTEGTTSSGYISDIRDPLVDWLTGNPSKPIRYIVCMLGVPTRISDGNKHSVQYRMSLALSETSNRNGARYEKSPKQFTVAEFKQNTALVTHINMGNLAVCQAYIDKLANADVVDSGTIRETYSGSGDYNYYLEDHNGYSSYSTFVKLRFENHLTGTFPYTQVDYNARGTSYITGGSHVLGYCGWGNNGGRSGNYANNGAIQWSSNANWWITTTIESFNGRRSTFQGNYIDWFANGAWGGSTYENTPIGAVCHVEELGIGGVVTKEFFNHWESGYLFAECAWASRSTPYFLAVGDPMVVKPSFS